MTGVKKQHLPTKICLHCNKPFMWRKKWEKNWDDLKSCSDWWRHKNKFTHFAKAS